MTEDVNVRKNSISAFHAGNDAWQKFIESCPNWDLSGADLSGNTTREEIANRELGPENFKDVYILKNGNCSGADFSRIDQIYLGADDTDFTHAKFIDANLRACHFSKCDFTKAKLSGAFLELSHFKECKIEHADLRNTEMREAKFYGGYFWWCDLRGAKTGDLTGVIVANCNVHEDTLGPWSMDVWSRMSRIYSFPRLIFDLFTLIIALLPNLILAGILIVAGDLYENSGGEAVRILFESFEVSNIGRMKEMPLIYIVLGGYKSPILFVAALSLIVFKVLRVFVTSRIVAMTQETRRTGVTPNYTSFKALLQSIGGCLALQDKLVVKIKKTLFDNIVPYTRTFGMAEIYHKASRIFLFVLLAYAIVSYWPFLFSVVSIPEALLSTTGRGD